MKQLARSFLKPVASLMDRARRPAPGITVLLYHRVGAGTTSDVDLPTADFEAQIAELTKQNRILSLDAAIATLRGNRLPDGPNPVVITFDDGTHDFVQNAMPVLEHHEAPATLYVATQAVDNEQPFWGDDSPALTWDQLGEASRSGLLTIGSHTHTHALLDRLEPTQIADELDISRDLIGTRLGIEAKHFAYPKALAPSEAAEVQVRARFESASLAGTRPNALGTDPFRLARSPVQTSDGMRFFRAKANGGMAFEDTARRLVNRRRYVGATS